MDTHTSPTTQPQISPFTAVERWVEIANADDDGEYTLQQERNMALLQEMLACSTGCAPEDMEPLYQGSSWTIVGLQAGRFKITVA